MKDNELNILYEDIILKNKMSPDGYDILLDKNITPIKIKYFFDRLFEKNILFELFSEDGEINIVYERKPWKTGIAFKYENVVGDIKFYTLITLFRNQNYSYKLENDIMDNIRHNKKVEGLKNIKSILDSSDGYIMGFRFEDENQLTHLTGTLKNKSVSIFSAVYRNIKHVYRQYTDINMTYCLVNRNEEKRVDLYKEIMKRTLKLNNYYLFCKINK